MNQVLMIQVSAYSWEIRSFPGLHVIQSPIHLNNIAEAEQYIKNYVSSFLDWHYTVVPLSFPETSIK